ncbi:MAG: deoxyribonuclease IV [Acidobacteriota bacterium]
MKDLLLGAHLSIAGGIPRAAESAAQLGCNTLQIFVKNSNRWIGRNLGEEEALEFKTLIRQHGIKSVTAHSSYLINLASPDEALRQKSIAAFIDELKRCAYLDINSLVIHPGSHRGEGESGGIKKIVDSLSQVLDESDTGVQITLETTAGQGSSLGHRFEHFRDIISGLSGHPSIGVCLDTCHIFTSGYDIRTKTAYEKTMETFDSVIGFASLSLVHLNDSLKPLGSRVDRHEHIGLGYIGDDAFKNLITDPRFEKISKILETPKDRAGLGDLENLEKLRSFHSK